MKLRMQSLASSTAGVYRMALLVLAQPLLLRFLGTERYGVWALLTVVLSLALLADTGLSQAVTALLPRERRESTAEGSTVVRVTLLFLIVQGLVVATAIMIFAAQVIQALLGHHDAEATLALRITAATVVPRLLQQWITAYEAGLMKYHVFAVAESVALTLQNAGLVVLAMRRASLPALAGWLLATTVAGIAIHWLAIGRPVPRGFRLPERKRWREVLTFGYSFWVTGVALTVFTQVDRLVVNAILGVEAVALYAVATGIGARINELAALPLRPMLPFVSGSAEPAQVRRAFVGGTIACTVVVATVTAGVVASAHHLASLISATHSDQLGLLIATIATVYGLYSLAAPAFLTLLGLRRVRLLAFTVWAGCLATLALIGLLAATRGLTAAAWGNAGFCIVLLMIFHAARASGASLPLVLTINAATGAFLLLFYAITSRLGALSISATVALLAVVIAGVGLAGYLAARRWIFAAPAVS